MTKHMDVLNEIAGILKERFDIPTDNFTGEGLMSNFFGYRYQMGYCDLLYLVKILEEKFIVCFNDEDYDNADFYCLNGIAKIIANKTVKTNERVELP